MQKLLGMLLLVLGVSALAMGDLCVAMLDALRRRAIQEHRHECPRASCRNCFDHALPPTLVLFPVRRSGQPRPLGMSRGPVLKFNVRFLLTALLLAGEMLGITFAVEALPRLKATGLVRLAGVTTDWASMR